MAQQYGFRASRSLAEVEDRDACLDNLLINRNDLLLLEGTSDTGVTENDYQSIINLSSDLETQIVALSGLADSKYSSMTGKATITGDTFTGPISGDIINNDRPYTTQSNEIIGPSTVSYFSPLASGLFSNGGEYKLGPVTASSTTASGLSYTGARNDYSDQYVKYKDFLNIQEEPSWTNRRIPLYLPPPTAISGCVTWLDSEYSAFNLDANGNVERWRGVGGGPLAAQSNASYRPAYVANTLNGKPAVRFDGSNDYLDLGNLSGQFPNAGTVIIYARVLDSVYNLFSTLNNSACRWNDGGRRSDLGVFTSTVQSNFGTTLPNNGTFSFSVRASNSYGLELRQSGVQVAYKSTGFSYNAGTSYLLGIAPGLTAALRGDIYAIALFDRVLSNKELKTMEEYFAWRYDGVYDPERPQTLDLEDFNAIQLEDGTNLTA